MEVEMDRIVISIHSMVDLITNSSTELFVLDTDKSLEIVKEILQSAIDLNNKANNLSKSFSDIFDEPTLGSGKSALDGWEDCYTSKIENGIILSGSCDNSIPYWMFNFIKDTFGYKTERFHLG